MSTKKTSEVSETSEVWVWVLSSSTTVTAVAVTAASTVAISAATIAGEVCLLVLVLPAPVQTNSAPFRPPQKSPARQEPVLGSPFRVFEAPLS